MTASWGIAQMPQDASPRQPNVASTDVDLALERSEARYRRLLESSHEGIWAIDAAGITTFVNARMAEMLGCTPAEMMGRVHTDFMWEEDRPKGDKDMELRRQGTRAVWDQRYRRKDGGELWTIASCNSLCDGDGRVVGALGMFTDISERKRAERELGHIEAELRASHRRFRAAIDAVQGVLWTNTADGEMRGEQRGWAALTGQAFDEYQGFGWAKAVHPEDAQPTIDAWLIAVRERRPFLFEHRVRRHDGAWRRFTIRAIPILGATGDIQEWVGVHTDVTEQRKTVEALRASEERLREADHRKDQFIATLSHELRNPLAPIRTAAQVLDRPALATGTLVWARQVIQRQVEHMASLLDDLLDTARITQGKLELNCSPVTLSSIVEAAVEASRPLLDAKQHRLRVELPEDDPVLQADALRLTQVLTNFLNNAAKYTDPAGSIELAARIDGVDLCLSVTDNGIGIPGEALDGIFRMFSQVKDTGRSDGGLGIGLALVRGIVELHGGTVQAQSEGAGLGSTFTARMPLVITTVGVPAPPVSTPLAAPTGCRRILIADDNEDAADALAMFLELVGHETRVAHGGGDALEIAQVFHPTVALLDIGMEDLSGYEVARALRAAYSGRELCLIAITGWGQETDRRLALEAGFDHHLTKPVNPGQIEALIAALCPRPP